MQKRYIWARNVRVVNCAIDATPFLYAGDSYRRDGREVGLSLLDTHDVRVLDVHVEQAHGMGSLGAIESAVLNEADVETAGVGVDHGRADTAAGGVTTADHRVGALLGQP